MGIFCPISSVMETKDRIRMIMEDQHMTQQVFADFLQQSPATLSSIFNGRTRPTLNIVEAIKSKIPDISTEWLLFGKGDMRLSSPQDSEQQESPNFDQPVETMLNFDAPISESSQMHHFGGSGASSPHGVRSTLLDNTREVVKLVEKPPRKVIEIRVYYDDQTFETFVPDKK